MKGRPRAAPEARRLLDRLYRSYDHPASAADPIEIVRRYRTAGDREVAGFCAAALAFGRVASVMGSIEKLFAVMGPSPAQFVRQFEPRRDADALAAIGHRWTRGEDLVALLRVLRVMLERHGSIERFFLEGYDRSGPDVGPALESFSTRARRLASSSLDAGGSRVARHASRARPGVRFFFPAPSSGSACKRLNLFLRWMVRADRVDLGVWRGVVPAHLIIPLDTHVIRVGRCLGLTRYATPGWKMAVEITRSLRRLDPDDPVKYDFALCHVGMTNACAFGRRASGRSCPLRGLCRPDAAGVHGGATRAASRS